MTTPSMVLTKIARAPFFMGVLLCVVAAGCITPRSSSPAAPDPLRENRAIDFRAAGKEVEEARRMIEAEDLTVVIPRLLHVISKYPASDAALDARFWLGVTYHRIKSYRDSIALFEEYIRLAPEGKYEVEAEEYIAKLTEEYNEKFISPEEFDARIKAVSEELREDRGNVGLRLRLADLLWKRGNYEESGELYYRVTRDHPEYAQDATVSSRIELQSGNGFTVLSPAEILRREIEAKPLAIVNTASFRSGKDLFTRENRHYVVSGQVFNRSDSVLYGVQVFVTLYGHGNMVYDSKTWNVGRLNPSERRAFSVQFSNFDNIENINRYECVGTFQR